MRGVRFFGPAGDTSGYGTAVSHFAKAFSQSSVKTKFVLDNSYGRKLIQRLENYDGRTDVDFYLHCPPYDRHHSKAPHKIAYFYWEADQLPGYWCSGIKHVDELWVPCELVKSACLKAKFTGPIKVIPTPCENWDQISELEIPALFSNDFVLSKDVYKFYSIFQWQNRKGWDNLLNSYYKTFTQNDNVILILKVNPLNIGDYTVGKIKSDILDVKRKLNLNYYPPVYLSTEVVPVEMIKSLHQIADCYVSPHHGEGWGMPIHDAMKLGKQLIVTQYGGITEYLDDNSAHIIKHSLGPVTGMEWSTLYSPRQSWAYPSTHHLSRLFRDVYENHKKYSEMGVNAQRIANKMTIPEISKMIERELG